MLIAGNISVLARKLMNLVALCGRQAVGEPENADEAITEKSQSAQSSMPLRIFGWNLTEEPGTNSER